VFVLRGFPGVHKAAYASVAELLHRPPEEAATSYNFNDRGRRVHYIFMKKHSSDDRQQAAVQWWNEINHLPDTGGWDTLSAGVSWQFVSRHANSTLHVDEADGTSSQVQGKKLWILVKQEKAAQHGIGQLDLDAMRHHTAGTHHLSAWQQCESFQWCILEAGETIITPRDRLHAVCCIGDVDAISVGSYCWLTGTTRCRPTFYSPNSVASASELYHMLRLHHQNVCSSLTSLLQQDSRCQASACRRWLVQQPPCSSTMARQQQSQQPKQACLSAQLADGLDDCARRASWRTRRGVAGRRRRRQRKMMPLCAHRSTTTSLSPKTSATSWHFQ
jgi:hypothetical protein